MKQMAEFKNAKIQEIRMMDMSDVRRMCIRLNLYTCCANHDDYGNMLKYANECDATSAELFKIAQDILSHSDIDALKEEYCMSINGLLEMIMFELNLITSTFYELQIPEV